jgi:hypothetical protein
LRLARSGRRHLVAPLTLAVLALAPAAAQATVTSSQITSPGDPYYRLDNGDLPGDQREVTVTGTTNGGAGDAVDLRCYYGQYWGGVYSNTLASEVPVQADGSFSYTGSISPLSNNQQACKLLAVDSYDGTPQDLSVFGGPNVAVTYVETSSISNLQDGTSVVRDFWVDAPGFKGAPQYYSAASDGIVDYTAVTNRAGYGLANYDSWDSAADLYGSAHDGRSKILVDGLDTYNNYSTPEFDPDGGGPLQYGAPPGLESLTYDVQVSPTNGDVKIVESTPLYICPEGAYPGDAGNCPELQKVGVRLDRTTLQQQDGLVVRVTDSLVSTDAKPHQVKLRYYNQSDFGDGPVWQLPGETGFGGISNGTSVGKPATPGSLTGRDWWYGQSVDSQISSTMTWLTQPDRLYFDSYDEPYSEFTAAVPAGGAAPVSQVFTAPRTVEEGQKLASDIEDATGSPVVEITAPANSTAVDHADIVVQGTARDNKSVSTLKVNGVPATVTGDGTWSLPLHLAKGANTITAVARDAQGNTGQAQVTVNYVPPKAAPLCVVPKVKRGAKQGKAKAAIKRANCKVGSVSKASSRKVRKGRVISIAPRAGYMLVRGSKIDIRVSSGKPKKAATKARSAKRH